MGLEARITMHGSLDGTGCWRSMGWRSEALRFCLSFLCSLALHGNLELIPFAMTWKWETFSPQGFAGMAGHLEWLVHRPGNLVCISLESLRDRLLAALVSFRLVFTCRRLCYLALCLRWLSSTARSCPLAFAFYCILPFFLFALQAFSSA